MHFSNNALQDAITLNHHVAVVSSTSSHSQWNSTAANRNDFVQRVLQTNYDQVKREMEVEEERACKRFKISG